MKHIATAIALAATLVAGASAASADPLPVWATIGAGCTLEPAAVRNDLVTVGPSVYFKGSATGTVKLWCPVSAAQPAVGLVTAGSTPYAYVLSVFNRAHVTYKDSDGTGSAATVDVCLRRLDTTSGAVSTLGCLSSNGQPNATGVVRRPFAEATGNPALWSVFGGSLFFEVTLSRTSTAANVDFLALGLESGYDD
jgi:hypothetical protein